MIHSFTHPLIRKCLTYLLTLTLIFIECKNQLLQCAAPNNNYETIYQSLFIKILPSPKFKMYFRMKKISFFTEDLDSNSNPSTYKRACMCYNDLKFSPVKHHANNSRKPSKKHTIARSFIIYG